MTLPDDIAEYLRLLDQLGFNTSVFSRTQTEASNSILFTDDASANATLALNEFFSSIRVVGRDSDKTVDQLNLFPGFVPLELGEAKFEYENLERTSDPRRKLFPLLTDFGGSFYCIDIERTSDTVT